MEEPRYYYFNLIDGYDYSSSHFEDKEKRVIVSRHIYLAVIDWVLDRERHCWRPNRLMNGGAPLSYQEELRSFTVPIPDELWEEVLAHQLYEQLW